MEKYWNILNNLLFQHTDENKQDFQNTTWLEERRTREKID